MTHHQVACNTERPFYLVVWTQHKYFARTKRHGKRRQTKPCHGQYADVGSYHFMIMVTARDGFANLVATTMTRHPLVRAARDCGRVCCCWTVYGARRCAVYIRKMEWKQQGRDGRVLVAERLRPRELAHTQPRSKHSVKNSSHAPCSQSSLTMMPPRRHQWSLSLL